MITNSKLIVVGVGGAIVLIGLGWLIFGHNEVPADPAGGSFGVGDTRTEVGVQQPQSTQPTGTGVNSSQKIFKIADGPVAGATFVETRNPTTTIARYILAENGRAFDVAVDVPGAVPRVGSNTTIPGVARVVWAGPAAILQYSDQNTLKTLSLGLPPATTSSAAAPVRIQFLPNSIIDTASSPDGTSITYALKTSAGSDGYIARADGSGARKLFSLPFSQVLLSWPTPATILVQTPPAYGVEGMAFSAAVATGAVTPLLHATGLTIAGDRALSRFLYHTTGGAAGRVTYAHDSASGRDAALSFDPLPEQCIWSRFATSTAYCATATTYVPENYGDLRRIGSATAAQQIVSYDEYDRTTVVATPGQEGGVISDIAEMALSLNEHYLLFIKKGERSLWGVRLTQ